MDHMLISGTEPECICPFTGSTNIKNVSLTQCHVT